MKFNSSKIRTSLVVLLILVFSLVPAFADTPVTPTVTVGTGGASKTINVGSDFVSSQGDSTDASVVITVNYDGTKTETEQHPNAIPSETGYEQYLLPAKSEDAKLQNNFDDTTATYIGSHVEASGLVKGGALANLIQYNSAKSSETLGRWAAITASFIDNLAHSTQSFAQGGALYNLGLIEGITGNFVFNGAKSDLSSAMGGAIFNDTYSGKDSSNTVDVTLLGRIGDIKGRFVNNYAYSLSSLAQGGAIYNKGTIDGIKTGSSFEYNVAKSDAGSAMGGAIYNSQIVGASVGNIEAAFKENKAIAKHTGDNIEAAGGAIYNTQKIGTGNGVGSNPFGITGNFEGNYAKATNTANYANVYGGAIFNSGTDAFISSIKGDFTNNYVKSSVESTSPDSYAYGGAIFNDKAIIGKIDGDFVGNQSIATRVTEEFKFGSAGGAIFNRSARIGEITGSFVNNKATIGTGISYGGAIYNDKESTIESISATSAISTATGTTDIKFEGNESQDEGGAIYNKGRIAIKAEEGNVSFEDNSTTRVSNIGSVVIYSDTEGHGSTHDISGSSNAVYNEGSLSILARDGQSVTFDSNSADSSKIKNNIPSWHDKGETIVNKNELVINAVSKNEMADLYEKVWVDGSVVSTAEVSGAAVKYRLKTDNSVLIDEIDYAKIAGTSDAFNYIDNYVDYTGTVNLQGVYGNGSMEIARGTVNAYSYLDQGSLKIDGKYDEQNDVHSDFGTLNIDANMLQISSTVVNNGTLNLYSGYFSNNNTANNTKQILGVGITGNGVTNISKNQSVFLLSGRSMDQSEVNVMDGAKFSADANAISARYDTTQPLHYKYLAEVKEKAPVEYDALAEESIPAAGATPAVDGKDNYSPYLFVVSAATQYTGVPAEGNASDYTKVYVNGTAFMSEAAYNAAAPEAKTGYEAKYIKNTSIIDAATYAASETQSSYSPLSYQLIEPDTIITKAQYDSKTAISKAAFEKIGDTENYQLKASYGTATATAYLTEEEYKSLSSDGQSVYELKYTNGTDFKDTSEEGYVPVYKLKAASALSITATQYNAMFDTAEAFEEYDYALAGGVRTIYVSKGNGELHLTSYSDYSEYPDEFYSKITQHDYYDENTTKGANDTSKLFIDKYVRAHEAIEVPVTISDSNNEVSKLTGFLYIDPDLLIGPKANYDGTKVTNNGYLILEANGTDDDGNTKKDTLANKETDAVGIDGTGTVVIGKGSVTFDTKVNNPVYINKGTTLITDVKNLLKDVTIDTHSATVYDASYMAGGTLKLNGGTSASDPNSLLGVNIKHDSNSPYSGTSGDTALVIDKGVVVVGRKDAIFNSSALANDVRINARKITVKKGAELDLDVSQFSSTNNRYDSSSTRKFDNQTDLVNGGIIKFTSVVSGKQTLDNSIVNDGTNKGTVELTSGSLEIKVNTNIDSNNTHVTRTIEQGSLIVDSGATLTADVAAFTKNNASSLTNGLANNGTLNLFVKSGLEGGSTNAGKMYSTIENRKNTLYTAISGTGKLNIQKESTVIANSTISQKDLTIDPESVLSITAANLKISNPIDNNGILLLRSAGSSNVSKFDGNVEGVGVDFPNPLNATNFTQSINDKSRTEIAPNSYINVTDKSLINDNIFFVGGESSDNGSTLEINASSIGGTNAVRYYNPSIASTGTPAAATLLLRGGLLDNNVKDNPAVADTSPEFVINTVLKAGNITAIANNIYVDNLELQAGSTLDLSNNFGASGSASADDKIYLNKFVGPESGSAGLSFDVEGLTTPTEKTPYVGYSYTLTGYGQESKEDVANDKIVLDKTVNTTVGQENGIAKGKIQLKSINILKEFTAPSEPTETNWVTRYGEVEGVSDLTTAVAKWKESDRRTIDLFVTNDTNNPLASQTATDNLTISGTSTVYGGYLYSFTQNTDAGKRGQLVVTRIPVSDWTLQDIIKADTKVEGTSYPVNTYTLTSNLELDNQTRYITNLSLTKTNNNYNPYIGKIYAQVSSYNLLSAINTKAVNGQFEYAVVTDGNLYVLKTDPTQTITATEYNALTDEKGNYELAYKKPDGTFIGATAWGELTDSTEPKKSECSAATATWHTKDGVYITEATYKSELAGMGYELASGVFYVKGTAVKTKAQYDADALTAGANDGYELSTAPVYKQFGASSLKTETEYQALGDKSGYEVFTGNVYETHDTSTTGRVYSYLTKQASALGAFEEYNSSPRTLVINGRGASDGFFYIDGKNIATNGVTVQSTDDTLDLIDVELKNFASNAIINNGNVNIVASEFKDVANDDATLEISTATAANTIITNNSDGVLGLYAGESSDASPVKKTIDITGTIANSGTIKINGTYDGKVYSGNVVVDSVTAAAGSGIIDIVGGSLTAEGVVTQDEIRNAGQLILKPTSTAAVTDTVRAIIDSSETKVGTTTVGGISTVEALSSSDYAVTLTVAEDLVQKRVDVNQNGVLSILDPTKTEVTDNIYNQGVVNLGTKDVASQIETSVVDGSLYEKTIEKTAYEALSDKSGYYASSYTGTISDTVWATLSSDEQAKYVQNSTDTTKYDLIVSNVITRDEYLALADKSRYSAEADAQYIKYITKPEYDALSETDQSGFTGTKVFKNSSNEYKTQAEYDELVTKTGYTYVGPIVNIVGDVTVLDSTRLENVRIATGGSLEVNADMLSPATEGSTADVQFRRDTIDAALKYDTTNDQVDKYNNGKIILNGGNLTADLDGNVEVKADSTVSMADIFVKEYYAANDTLPATGYESSVDVETYEGYNPTEKGYYEFATKNGVLHNATLTNNGTILLTGNLDMNIAGTGTTQLQSERAVVGKYAARSTVADETEGKVVIGIDGVLDGNGKTLDMHRVDYETIRTDNTTYDTQAKKDIASFDILKVGGFMGTTNLILDVNMKTTTASGAPMATDNDKIIITDKNKEDADTYNAVLNIASLNFYKPSWEYQAYVTKDGLAPADDGANVTEKVEYKNYIQYVVAEKDEGKNNLDLTINGKTDGKIIAIENATKDLGNGSSESVNREYTFTISDTFGYLDAIVRNTGLSFEDFVKGNNGVSASQYTFDAAMTDEEGTVTGYDYGYVIKYDDTHSETELQTNLGNDRISDNNLEDGEELPLYVYLKNNKILVAKGPGATGDYTGIRVSNEVDSTDQVTRKQTMYLIGDDTAAGRMTGFKTALSVDQDATLILKNMKLSNTVAEINAAVDDAAYTTTATEGYVEVTGYYQNGTSYISGEEYAALENKDGYNPVSPLYVKETYATNSKSGLSINETDIANKGNLGFQGTNTVKTITSGTLTDGETDKSLMNVIDGNTTITAGGSVVQHDIKVNADATLSTEYKAAVTGTNPAPAEGTTITVDGILDNEGTLNLDGTIITVDQFVDLSENQTGVTNISHTVELAAGEMTQKTVTLKEGAKLKIDEEAIVNVGKKSSSFNPDTGSIDVTVTAASFSGPLATVENNGDLNIYANKDTVFALSKIEGTGDMLVEVKNDLVNDKVFNLNSSIKQNSLTLRNADVFNKAGFVKINGVVEAGTITNQLEGIVVGENGNKTLNGSLTFAANVKGDIVNESYNDKITFLESFIDDVKTPVLIFDAGQSLNPIKVEGKVTNSGIVQVKSKTSMTEFYNKESADIEKTDGTITKNGYTEISNGASLTVTDGFKNDFESVIMNDGTLVLGVKDANVVPNMINEGLIYSADKGMVDIYANLNNNISNEYTDEDGTVYEVDGYIKTKDLTVENGGSLTTKLQNLNITNADNKITVNGTLNITSVGAVGMEEVGGDTRKAHGENDIRLNIVSTDKNGIVDIATGEDVTISGTIDGAEVMFHSGTMTFGYGDEEHQHIVGEKAGLHIMDDAEAINLKDDVSGVTTYGLGKVILDTSIDMPMDFQLKDEIKMDQIAGTGATVNNHAMITISGLPAKEEFILRKANIDLDPFAEGSDQLREDLKGHIQMDETFRVLSPIFKYHVDYDETKGLIHLTTGNDYDSFNPGIYDGMVAALTGGLLSEVNSFEEAFMNEDTRQMTGLSGKKEKGGITARSYGTQEYLDLVPQGPTVKSVMYGAYADMDTNVMGGNNTWTSTLNGYATYDGSHQTYDGVTLQQYGAHFGAKAFFYRDNFYVGATANLGFNNIDAKTAFGDDEFAQFMGGTAIKIGFNWTLDDKITFQPHWQLSQTHVKTYDYIGAPGVEVTDKPFNAMQLSAGFKFVDNLKKHNAKLYSDVKFVYTNGTPTFYAFDVELPTLGYKPYIQLNIGYEKTWSKHLMGYVQAGGKLWSREGLSVTAGFKLVF